MIMELSLNEVKEYITKHNPKATLRGYGFENCSFNAKIKGGLIIHFLISIPNMHSYKLINSDGNFIESVKSKKLIEFIHKVEFIFI